MHHVVVQSEQPTPNILNPNHVLPGTSLILAGICHKRVRMRAAHPQPPRPPSLFHLRRRSGAQPGRVPCSPAPFRLPFRPAPERGEWCLGPSRPLSAAIRSAGLAAGALLHPVQGGGRPCAWGGGAFLSAGFPAPPGRSWDGWGAGSRRPRGSCAVAVVCAGLRALLGSRWEQDSTGLSWAALKEEGASRYSGRTGERVEVNGHLGKASRKAAMEPSDVTQGFCTARVVMCCNKLPKEVMGAPSLQAFKAMLDGALSSLI